jgi:AraC family transcriptional regulator, dual regulator of chb operon
MNHFLFNTKFPKAYYKHFRFEQIAAYRQHESGIHTHDYSEIFWVYEGEGIHQINGKERSLKTGSLGFIQSADLHGYYGLGKSGLSWVNVPLREQELLSIQNQFSQHNLKFLEMDIDEPSLFKLNPLQNVWMKQAFNQLTQGKMEQFLLHRFLINLLYELLNRSEIGESLRIPNWIKICCDQIKKPEHLIEGPSRLVALTKYSAEHVAREFQRYLGKTPTEVINETRLQVAVKRLIESSDSILDISLDCGFNNLSYFYKIFKKKYGIPPRKYRLLNQ